MKTVLVVDDSDNMRMTIKALLERNGFQIVGESGDGASAIEKYKELKPDVVTMDVTMSGMDGMEAMKQIIEFDPEAKVVMVSAMGQDVYVKEAIIAGAKGYIVKPFSMQQLVETFGKL